jgi:hypothetical protein
MNAALFHGKRRMFAVVAGRVFVSDRGDIRGHREWLGDAYSDGLVRGYHMDQGGSPGLYAYRGDDFRGDAVVVREVVRVLPELAYALDLGGEEPIWIGVTPGEAGEQWPGIRRLGVVEEFVTPADVKRAVFG